MKASLFAVPVAVLTLNLLTLSGCGPAEPNAARPERAGTEEEIATSRSALRDGGWVKIVPAHSLKCLDVENASTANGALVRQWDCWNGANQWFQTRRLYNGWSLVAGHSGKCLEIRDGSYTNGASIQQSDCNGSWSQQFNLSLNSGQTTYMITSARDYHMALDVAGYSLSNGAQVVLWESSYKFGEREPNLNQMFYFVE